MTVAELIAELQKFPPDKQVYVSDSDYGPEPVTEVRDNRKWWQDYWRSRHKVDTTKPEDDFVLLSS